MPYDEIEVIDRENESLYWLVFYNNKIYILRGDYATVNGLPGSPKAGPFMSESEAREHIRDVFSI